MSIKLKRNVIDDMPRTVSIAHILNRGFLLPINEKVIQIKSVAVKYIM